MMKTNEDWQEFKEACRYNRASNPCEQSGDTCRWWNKGDSAPGQSLCADLYCPRLKGPHGEEIA